MPSLNMNSAHNRVRPSRRTFPFLIIVLLCGAAFSADQPGFSAGPLPQDTGVLGLRQMLVRLRTTARLMHTAAHPDDEDGGMLTLESRGKGATVVQLTLNRGEGGQNKVGGNLFDELGVIRTLELVAADEYYGVEQRFTRVADFGFSKTPEETFEKWHGHDVALADMVRVIRTFRPDVIVSRFQGASRDGHGHHQASGILTREAFRAAVDPRRFPEQVRDGLQPWQAKKLYVDNVHEGEDYTLLLNTGKDDPLLGMSYVQFAMQGLRHQLSQGAGAWQIEPGDHYSRYKLVDSVLPPSTGADGHEQNFFDGIDTSVPGLALRLGEEQAQVPYLRPALSDFESKIQTAANAAAKDPSRAVMPLVSALNGLNNLLLKLQTSDLSAPTKADLLERLREKQRQCETATNLAMNVSLEATVVPPSGTPDQLPAQRNALTIVSPGQSLTVVAKFHNGSKDILQVEDVALDGAQGWISNVYKSRDTILQPGEDYYANFGLRVPADAAYTRPYFHRPSPQTDTLYEISEPKDLSLPFTPPPLHAHLRYSIVGRKNLTFGIGARPIQVGSSSQTGSQIFTTVIVPYRDEDGHEGRPALAVGPAFSVMLDPVAQVIPAGSNTSRKVTVNVSSNIAVPASGTLRLEIPAGWKSDPPQLSVKFSQRGEQQKFDFMVKPEGSRETRADLKAVFESGDKKYSEGYSVITRRDLGTTYYYQPATQRVSIVDVHLPHALKIGYIMGAGDDIPTVLQQVGLDVTLISPQELASGDLNRYGTIVTVIRAYDTRDDVRANNRRLLDYVSNGGTLIVQYNAGAGDFNSGNYTPFSAHLSHDRVTVEEAPVEILASQDSIFHAPNQIRTSDFDGWVQERGLYFMDQWDSHFEPLLASHDPGEQPLKGGLLRARYGKGEYIYTGYAFFRQLPAGVPGAIRLYVNLLAAGHEK